MVCYMKEDGVVLDGVVVESFPNATFKIRLNNGIDVLCGISGKIRKFNIRITVGDSVVVELSPYDLTRGRIVRRK